MRGYSQKHESMSKWVAVTGTRQWGLLGAIRWGRIRSAVTLVLRRRVPRTTQFQLNRLEQLINSTFHPVETGAVLFGLCHLSKLETIVGGKNKVCVWRRLRVTASLYQRLILVVCHCMGTQGCCWLLVFWFLWAVTGCQKCGGGFSFSTSSSTSTVSPGLAHFDVGLVSTITPRESVREAGRSTEQRSRERPCWKRCNSGHPSQE